MSKLRKSLMIMAIASIIAVCGAIPALANITYPKEVCVYLIPEKKGRYFEGGRLITVSGLKDNQSIGKNIKSSNKSVAIVTGVQHTHITDTYENFNKKTTKKNSSKNADIKVTIKKPGTSTISFQIDGKTYKTKVKAYKYVNPLKSLTISGYNNGKSVHTVFDKEGYYYEPLNNNIYNAKVTVKTKSDWALTSLYVSDGDRNMTVGSIVSANGGKYLKKFSSLSANKLNITKEDNGLSVWAYCVNRKNGELVQVEYNLGHSGMNN